MPWTRELLGGEGVSASAPAGYRSKDLLLRFPWYPRGEGGGRDQLQLGSRGDVRPRGGIWMRKDHHLPLSRAPPTSERSNRERQHRAGGGGLAEEEPAGDEGNPRAADRHHSPGPHGLTRPSLLHLRPGGGASLL